MARLADVARAAGVSTSTASRALSRPGMVATETRERVLRAASELGFRFNASARALTTGRTGLVGVVVPTLANPYFPPIVTGVQRALEDRGGHTLLAVAENSAGRERELASRLATHVDGLVLVSPLGSDGDVRELAARLRIATVDRLVPGVSGVVCDTGAGVAALTRHLTGLGHRRIGYVGGPPGSWMDARRRQAITGVVRGAGGELVETDPAPPRIDAGLAAAERFAAGGVTAVVAYSSYVLIGLLMGLQAAGLRVPEDISLVASDDLSPLGATQPGVTALRVPLDETGAAASRLVLGDEPSLPATVEYVPTEIVIRASTAPPPAHP